MERVIRESSASKKESSYPPLNIDFSSPPTKVKVKGSSPKQSHSFDLTPTSQDGRSEFSVLKPDCSWSHSPIQCDTSLPFEHQMNPTEEAEFMKVVASIVIQTFYRRHLAYRVSATRYRSVLVIQRFLRSCLEQKSRQNDRFAMVSLSSHSSRTQQQHKQPMDLYELAATKIQAAFRGWWQRDCLQVDTYCATIIQRNFRCYMAQIQYFNDLYCIIRIQSVVRRFLAQKYAVKLYHLQRRNTMDDRISDTDCVISIVDCLPTPVKLDDGKSLSRIDTNHLVKKWRSRVGDIYKS